MIRRLVEADYFSQHGKPRQQQLRFWFLELRTPELSIELAAAHPQICRRLIKQRSLLRLVAAGRENDLTAALTEEERLERDADREYWAPLKAELEQLSRARLRNE